MKLPYYFRIIALALLAFLESCSPNDEQLAEGYLNATANEEEYISSAQSGGLMMDRYSTDLGTISFQLSSTSDDNKNIAFVIPNFNGIGIYNIKQLNGSWMEFSSGTDRWHFDRHQAYSNESDYIEIINISKNNIEGKFLCHNMINQNTAEKLVLQGEFKGKLLH
ncbi:hypothetical protein [Zunongwangia sp. H14]|uniref:hypothetical protein n=1 Tax=Zunongwangia sp. H14 TaxID=3240792 RepID=UPI003568ABD8